MAAKKSKHVVFSPSAFGFLLLALLSLLPTGASAQKEGQALIDSLLTQLSRKHEDTSKVSLLNNLSFNYGYIDPTTGKSYGLKAMKLAQKLHWNDGLATAYRNIGINVSINSEYKDALQWYFRALKQKPNEKIRSAVLRSIGLVYTYMTDYKKALDYDMRALELAESLGDKKGQAAVLSNIGIIYYDLEDFKSAIAYYDRARQINEEMGNLIFLSNNLGNLGNCYHSIKDYDKSILYYRRAIELNDSVGDQDNKAINLGSIADVYAAKKQYQKALDYNAQSFALHSQTGNDRGLVFNYELLGKIKLALSASESGSKKQALLLESEQYYNKAKQIYSSLNDRNGLATTYEQLSKINEMQGQTAEAFDFFKKSVVYKDSIFNSETKQTIKTLEDKRAIEVRDKQIQVNKLRLAAKEREKWLYIMGITLLAIIGVLLFYQSRSRRRTNDKLKTLNAELYEADRVKTRFFSILNHDLRAPVARLISFLKLQKENPELLDDQSRERMEKQTMASAENLLESMEDMLLWTKGQMENFSPKPRSVEIAAAFHEIEQYFAGENVSLEFEHNNVWLETDPDYLKTIMRNLTANSIKALGNTANARISWKAWKEHGNAFLSVSDNGPGASHEKFRALFDEKEVVGIKTGLGLHLIRDLAKAIDCEISVSSEPGKGTRFELSFGK